MANLRNPAVKSPTVDELRKISDELGFKCSEEELLFAQEHYQGAYQKVFDMVEETPPVKYPRLPGHREKSDPAWYWRCDIKGAEHGLLKGKTIAIKDNIAVAGVPMMCGSKLLEGYMPEFDATVVSWILDQGGQILGKSTCEDMCSTRSSWTCATGAVPNPYDPTRTSGGSSSGSASLVSRGLVDMALGSDQGGSIRMPSSWCGIVGLKPTFGLVPYTGSVSLESTVDHLGPMTRTVDDCALLLEAIAGYDDGLDPRQHRDLKVPKYSKHLNKSIKGTKIAVLKEGFEGVDDDVCRVVKTTISKLQAEGATVEDVSIPKHNDGSPIAGPILSLGIQKNILKESGVGYGWKGFYPTSLAEKLASSVKSRPFEISFPLKMSLMFGDYIERNYQKKFYCKAQNLRRVLCKAYDDVLEHYDAIVMPTTSGKPLKLPTKEHSFSEIIDLSYGLGKNMSSFNVTGHPAISVNAGFTDGLPCGMMIVGKMFDDLTVLQVAKTVENVVKK
ncbi:hypothetical protein FSP39_004401 [Pinctada imbricata]|uniref:Amidase domain-containing protein n=1 Tax=Pinctada imbricata TaxID=66713 RepID=A0AA89C9W1_PINIB|nr:hypothetical protein FSP39_004401 [Pinctada imbricata]